MITGANIFGKTHQPAVVQKTNNNVGVQKNNCVCVCVQYDKTNVEICQHLGSVIEEYKGILCATFSKYEIISKYYKFKNSSNYTLKIHIFYCI